MLNTFFQKSKGSFFIASFLFSIGIIFFLLAQSSLPIHEGQRFGNIPLERKIEKLIELEKKEGIDAIFLGASTVDFGISAKVFSEEVTAATGKKFVAFNFGTGGGDYFVLPDFVKIIELHSKPKFYFIQAPLLTAANPKVISNSPFRVILRDSQVGKFLDSVYLFEIMNRIWNLEGISKMPSLRSKIITGKIQKAPTTNSDLYSMNEYGDSISYNHIDLNQGKDLVDKAKKYFRYSAIPNVMEQYPLSRDTKAYSIHFKPEYINLFLSGFGEIKRQTKNAKSEMILISFPYVAIESTFDVFEELKIFNRKLDFYIGEISSRLNLKYLNARDDLHLRTWHVQDDTHYNTYAAEIIGKKLAEKFLNQSLPKEPEASADALFALEKDKNLGRSTAIIRSPSSLEKNFLVLKYLQNANTRILPSKKENVNIALRLEKNISRIFKVERLDNNTFGVKIPENLLKTNALYAVDLASESMQSLGMPLESYHWEKK
jgi:hypothetical protein